MDLVYDDHGNRTRLSRLAESGVKVWGPERVYVSGEVQLDRIAPGAVLMNAMISGATTFIGAGAQIGTSGLARIHEAQIGGLAILGAGYYEHCVLFNGAKVRGFAEFRPGTVLEEQAETGHNVGLKNTVLTAGVVAGSSINFCDVLLSGGTSRNDHSEIGSGVVHFNFDPRGDKFGSLMGDAAGCLLKSRRIFVGGNSGIVAPLHLDYGAVVAAGSTLRHSVAENQLSGGDPTTRSGDYDLEQYFDLSNKFSITAKLVGNLHAMHAWYRYVRQACADADTRLLCVAAEQEFDRHIKHRTGELAKVVGKLELSLSKPRRSGMEQIFDQQHRRLLANREHINSLLLREDYPEVPEAFLTEYANQRRTRAHIESVQALSGDALRSAGRWIHEIASGPYSQMRALFT